jgi:galacturan 1,4-alpha-galacturonidase
MAPNLILWLFSLTLLHGALGSSNSYPFVVPQSPAKSGQVCTVTPLGPGQDDVPQLLKAFEACDGGGTVVFPENYKYHIATRLNPVLHDVTIEWRGTWVLSSDMQYWQRNSYPIAFQNHRAAFVISGDRIKIDGYGTGGIDGQGDVWYSAEAGNTKPGRPMPMVFWNTSEVVVERFFVKQPPLWAINIMNGTNMRFDNVLVNATALSAPWGKNWVQNTDGFDTMDCKNISLTNFVFQGACLPLLLQAYSLSNTGSLSSGRVSR